MHPSLRRCLICALALVLTVGCAAAGAENLHQSRSRLKAIRAKIESIKHNLASSRSRKQDLQADLQQAEKAIATQTQAIASLNQRIKTQNRKIAATEGQIDTLTGQVQQETELLQRQIRAAFEMGREPKLQVLLNQQDPAAVGRVMVYYDYLNRARTRQIHEAEEKLKKLQHLKARLNTQHDHLTQLKSQRAGNLDALKQARSARRQALARLSKHIESGSEKLTQLKHSEARLQNLIQKLQRQLQQSPSQAPAGTPLGRLKGHLPWPVKGKLLARFGTPKANGAVRSKGIWIAAAQGTPVKAVAAGRVVFAGWLQRFGLIVIIQHAGGYYSLYGHDQVVFHNVGDQVSQGEVIAKAGDTGGYSQSGVYLEIRRGAKPLNPLHWLVH